MKFYAVEARCGHVGKNNYTLKTFGLVAEDGRQAAEIARTIPRVKHDHKFAIESVTEIDYWTYVDITNDNRWDPYFVSGSIQEQRENCNYELTVYSEEQEERETERGVNWKIRSYEKRKKEMDKHFSLYLELEAA